MTVKAFEEHWNTLSKDEIKRWNKISKDAKAAGASVADPDTTDE